jgi:plasmid stabilization system protein ParE
MKLQYSRRATAQYTEILVYLTEQNPQAALRFYNRAEAALARLRTFPLLGSYTREFEHLSVRQILVEPYRFFYIFDQAQRRILIVDVWHVAQLPDEPQLPAP